MLTSGAGADLLLFPARARPVEYELSARRMLLDLQSWPGTWDMGLQARVALPGLFVGWPRRVFSEVIWSRVPDSEALAFPLSYAPEERNRGGDQVRRLFETLNTLPAVLAVTVIVVAANSFLFFGYYSLKTTMRTTSPPQIERTTIPTTGLEKTRPTTTLEEARHRTTPGEMTTSTATAIATSSP